MKGIYCRQIEIYDEEQIQHAVPFWLKIAVTKLQKQLFKIRFLSSSPKPLL